ncbi:MAG: carboxypeptidase-like regulatory domain-containing protein, partial [Acidobacteriia bacterium]|nr:carboxypeptidase-like regulatory domain-containing protein [Terriglobia bacterium]
MGKVTDVTHADLFDVLITVTNSQTGVSRQLRTDEYGKYAVEPLLPGNYTIKAEGEGLETYQVTGV